MSNWFCRTFLPAALESTPFGILVVVGILCVQPAIAQQGEPKSGPVVVRPGAPGQPTRVLPSDTRSLPPARSPKDVEFMQGMIMHHAQAVEMTALIAARTEHKGVRSLGVRISHAQSEEMKLMKNWLEIRGEPVEMKMADSPGSHSHGSHAEHEMMMPGMLSPEQMRALRKATGGEFDRLFLAGMIQHHEGALSMVKDLFDTPGAGQDAELFNFASDVDSGQRAEIKLMQDMLGAKPVKDKP